MGSELEIDAEVMRHAGELAAAEWMGRVRDNAAELGD
jgi:hypothetical protein